MRPPQAHSRSTANPRHSIAKENSNAQLAPAHLASALLQSSTTDSQVGATTLFSSILNKAGAQPELMVRALAKQIVRLPSQEP